MGSENPTPYGILALWTVNCLLGVFACLKSTSYAHFLSECFDRVRSVLADESKMVAPMLPRAFVYIRKEQVHVARRHFAMIFCRIFVSFAYLFLFYLARTLAVKQ